MSIDYQDLELIAVQVWELALGSHIVRAPDQPLPPQTASQVAHVALTGAYDAVVALDVSEGVVRQAAASMFGTNADALSDEEFTDTARELANMVGGNLKCLVEQPTHLGLPQVTPAEEFYRNQRNAVCQFTFELNGDLFRVSMFAGDRA